MLASIVSTCWTFDSKTNCSTSVLVQLRFRVVEVGSLGARLWHVVLRGPKSCESSCGIESLPTSLQFSRWFAIHPADVITGLGRIGAAAFFGQFIIDVIGPKLAVITTNTSDCIDKHQRFLDWARTVFKHQRSIGLGSPHNRKHRRTG